MPACNQIVKRGGFAELAADRQQFVLSRAVGVCGHRGSVSVVGEPAKRFTGQPLRDELLPR